MISKRWEDFYLSDMGALGVQRPDIEPHAVASIPEMRVMIANLIARGAAYAAQGHVLFDVTAVGDYGALSRRPLDEMIAGARVEVAPYKKNPADFVLWKPSEADQPGWESPWGRGRPGWHIECSAMIAANLGTTIDIHGGGQDLIFPHHENEAAQSACAHGAPLANFWLHNGFLNMGDTKMSKSLGNIVSVGDLLDAGWDGAVLRLALLSAHYRQPLAWTTDLLDQTKALLERWRRVAGSDWRDSAPPPAAVVAALADDLNTPRAFAALSALASDGDAPALRGALAFIGVGPAATDVDPEIDALVAARTAARARRDWAESDRIRDVLSARGIVLEDGAAGTSWRRS